MPDPEPTPEPEDRLIVTSDHPPVPERGGEATNETTLQEAERIINGPRRDAYGDAVESFDRIAAGWSVIVGTEVNGTQVALCMDWLKLLAEWVDNPHESLGDWWERVCGFLSRTEPSQEP